MKFRRSAVVGLMVSGLLGGVLTVAPAASAIAGTAPACVTRDVVKHEKYVKVTNLCGKAMHLKVVIDWGPDSGCYTYQHGEYWEWRWRSGSYGKVVTC